MNKLQMAHEWAMRHGKTETIGDRENTVKNAWDYAGKMQAEWDKCEKEKQEKLKNGEDNYYDA